MSGRSRGRLGTSHLARPAERSVGRGPQPATARPRGQMAGRRLRAAAFGQGSRPAAAV